MYDENNHWLDAFAYAMAGFTEQKHPMTTLVGIDLAGTEQAPVYADNVIPFRRKP